MPDRLTITYGRGRVLISAKRQGCSADPATARRFAAALRTGQLPPEFFRFGDADIGDRLAFADSLDSAATEAEHGGKSPK